MNDVEIRKIIFECVCAEMETLPEKDALPEHQLYSHRFNRKMKHIMRAGDWFGGSLRLYKSLYRAAAVLLVVASLAVANQVSAAVFGFDPWNAILEIVDPSVKMIQHTYHKNSNETKSLEKPISSIPTYIPEGYVEVENKSSEKYLSMAWDDVAKQDDKYGILYDRDLMKDGMSIKENADYENKYRLVIAGYDAYVYSKGEEWWLHWFDDNYSYWIWSYGLDDARDELKHMAESIYKK